MFDIGFWELVLISVIGLVVLGPQRLPIAIRTVLKWVNTAKNMANSVKSEISQELELHEINENVIQKGKQELEQINPDLKASINKIKQDVEQFTEPYKKEVDELKKATTDTTPPVTNEAASEKTPQQDK